MQLVRAFVAGLAFPATVAPFLHWWVFDSLPDETRLATGFVPLIFAVWNVLFVAASRAVPSGRSAFLTGGVLGLIVSFVGTFVLHVPQMLFGLVGASIFAFPLLVILLYGAIWRYVVHYLNHVLSAYPVP